MKTALRCLNTLFLVAVMMTTFPSDAGELILEAGPTVHLQDKNNDGMLRIQVEGMKTNPLRQGHVFGKPVTMRPAFSGGVQASMEYVGIEFPWRVNWEKSYTELSWGLIFLIDWDKELTGTRWQHQLGIGQGFRMSDSMFFRASFVHHSNGAGYAGGSKPNPGQNYLVFGISFVLP